jgi:hypothetical protein
MNATLRIVSGSAFKATRCQSGDARVARCARATLTLKRAPIMANLHSIFFAFIGFDLRFHPEPHWTKDKVEFRGRSDPEGAIWLVALAKEQLALITENRLHGISFVNGLE